MALLSGALLSTTVLFAFSARANADAHRVTAAALLARDAIDRLRAASRLDVSPLDSLTRSYPDFADLVDRFGQRVDAGDQLPPAAAYVRRWSIRPSGPAPDDPLVIEVVACSRELAGSGDLLRVRGAVRLVTLTGRSP